MSSYKTIGQWLLLALVWAISVSLTFLTWGLAPAAVGVFVQAAAAAVTLTFFFSRQASEVSNQILRDWRSGRRQGVFWFGAAAIVLAASLLLTVIKRYGFAPSGSDIVFLLATAPVFVMLFSRLLTDERLTFGKIVGSAAALLGGMAVVGNWERPSSFSPFSRFPVEEAFLLASAALLGLFVAILWKLAKSRSASGSATVIVWLTLPGLLLAARIFNGWVGFSEIGMDGYAILAAAGAVGVALPVLLLAALTKKTDAGKAAAALFLSPVTITLLIGVEKISGASGVGIMPTPFEWAPVLAGSVAIIAGAAAIWRS